MKSNQQIIKDYLKTIKTTADRESAVAQSTIEKDLSKTSSAVRQMNAKIKAVLGTNTKVNTPAEIGNVYNAIQKQLGGLTIQGEKFYSPQLLDAHSQSVIFFKTLPKDKHFHTWYGKVPHYLAPTMKTHDKQGRTTGFEIIHSGQTLKATQKKQTKKEVAIILAQQASYLENLLQINPSHANKIVNEVVENALKQSATKKRMQNAFSSTASYWDGSSKQRLSGKPGLTIEQFSESLRAQMAADYIVFCFDGTDAGVPYSLAQQYISTFSRFAPLTAVIKVGHFADLYKTMPSLFVKDQTTVDGESVPMLRFDRNRVGNAPLWENLLGKRNVQLHSPIPSGMFIQHAANYNKKDALINYAKIKRRGNERIFHNTSYNFVRRRLFRGYDNL